MANNNDTRSPITDALETLGMVHFKPESRDAIHLAVEPVTAGVALTPGQPVIVEFNDEGQGTAYPCPRHESMGIIDPFLNRAVATGEKCWFVMKPREVRSLRHVWEHPNFPAGK